MGVKEKLTEKLLAGMVKGKYEHLRKMAYWRRMSIRRKEVEPWKEKRKTKTVKDLWGREF